MEHYLGDFAYLAHRLMEMEKFPVLFAIGLMDDRIQVVARSLGHQRGRHLRGAWRRRACLRGFGLRALHDGA